MLELDFNAREKLVERLAKWSSLGTPDGPDYFKFLVKQANFDDDLRSDGLAGYVGNAKYNAQRLVEWAVGIDTNPQDRNKALGSILLPMMRGGIGLEDRTFIAGMIITYRLVQSEATLQELRARYQIPERPQHAATLAGPLVTGPTIQWTKETGDLELQGWRVPEPQLLDLETVMTAAKRARSVCRLEVGAIGTGTGVLIKRDLVLTNYHVMGGDLSAARTVLEANARNTVLRFGAFSVKGSAAAGQEVRLHQQAIVECSVAYDFALLRTDGSIEGAVDVEPYFEIGTLPVKTNPLRVLQHPEGGPMMLALSSNGVTWIDPGLVNLQYITNVAGGSSGSPCFDADWRLVALHHAGAGAKGEGILMQSIHGQIRQYLSA
jgi:V8-like Glu-specific endopeptidase